MENGFDCRNRIFHFLLSLFRPRFFLPITLAAFISGCTPAGPSALLKGKKYLDRGNYDAAVEKLKTATTLMATNAQAWNYYGVALQHAGRGADAMLAYQNALKYDRDLLEAHYNLGCLWLEMGKPDAAKTEFTAYTLRRNNSPEGWLKLGMAQMEAGDVLTAEKSFSTANYLSPNNAEALNGLGLARVKRDRLREAAQFFDAAIKAHPDYAPAILNLAIVCDRLHDEKAALADYRDYLALKPRPEKWDEVNALVNHLEPQAPSTPPHPTPPPAPERESAPAPPPVASHETRPAPAPRQTAPPREQAEQKRPVPPPEVVRVQPEKPVQTTPKPSEPEVRQTAPAETQSKTSAWTRLNPATWFHSNPPSQQKYTESGVTPLPSNRTESAPAKTSPPPPVKRPIKLVQPAPPTFPRYLYLSPPKPKAGNRNEAIGYFTEAQQFEKKRQWVDAMESYRKAAQLDPSWFEAQYNWGVLAYRLRDYSKALAADEMALAIKPDSVDARYNFAVALRDAGYVTDAVNELKRLLEANPDEVRAHLALGKIYADQIHNIPLAREHYQKVLALDPRNPQASNIQFWLSANPP